MLKYLPGILIIQVATVAMTLAVLKSGDHELWLSVVVRWEVISYAFGKKSYRDIKRL